MSRPYRDLVFCVNRCCFVSRLYHDFLFRIDWGACTNMNCSAQMQLALVGVPLFGGVHLGALLCSRDHALESHSYLLLGPGCIGDSAFCASLVIPGGADARCSGIMGVFLSSPASGDGCVVYFWCRLHRDFVFCVSWCCCWCRL